MAVSLIALETCPTAPFLTFDAGTPNTVFFAQSNHLYAGGDASAFNNRYPATVTTVTLKFVIG